jgi:hypothetical protein
MWILVATLLSFKHKWAMHALLSDQFKIFNNNKNTIWSRVEAGWFP